MATTPLPRERIPDVELYLRMAELHTLRSTCLRKQVGAVITSWDLKQVVATGYNGNYRGGPNVCDYPERRGGCRCVHAESTALIKAPYGDPLVLFCTHSPCVDCAKLIANSSVRRFVYRHLFREVEGLEILTHAGVEITNLVP